MLEFRRQVHRARHWLAAAALVAGAMLAGCDVKKLAELEVGVATEAGVRTKWC